MPTFEDFLMWLETGSLICLLCAPFLVSKAVEYMETKHRLYVAKKICVVDSPEQWEEAYSGLEKDLRVIKVLGLDCEWVESHKVALLQLASPSGLCILVRLFKLWPSFPESLRLLLADSSILKVGAAIIGDAKKLHRDYDISVCGCVDLRNVLKRTREAYHCYSRGLRGLAAGVLQVDINKDVSVRCGNWEAETYTQQQIQYAATDAVVAVDIFLSMVFNQMKTRADRNKRLLKLSDTPSSLDSAVDTISEESDRENLHSVRFVCYAVASQNPFRQFPTDRFDVMQDHDRETIWRCARSLCQGLVEAVYAYKSKRGNLPSLSKQREKPKSNAYECRKRPLWDNCWLQAPDGTLLCTCDAKKAQWYLNKELGDVVCESPLTVRLRFEPSNRQESERNYYIQEKSNVCVVCGCDKNYIRKFIVPFEYRKFFPRALKDKSSHDVLLLCTDCHKKSSDSDLNMRLQLAEECNAPLDSGLMSKMFIDPELQKVRSAGRALLAHKNSIPEDRAIELEKLLQNFYGVDSVTEELIKQAAETNAKKMTENYIPHAQKVVEHMANNSGLLTFQRRWRQHFLDTMNPQYLPAFWSVEFSPRAWSH
ncbi:hypothetical protein BsWGS_00698 [Bradybaena similaris]